MFHFYQPGNLFAGLEVRQGLKPASRLIKWGWLDPMVSGGGTKKRAPARTGAKDGPFLAPGISGRLVFGRCFEYGSSI